MKLLKVLLLALMIPIVGQAQNAVRAYNAKDLFDARTSKTTFNDTLFTQYEAYDAWGDRLRFYMIASDTTQDSLTSVKVRNRYTEQGSNWNTCLTFGVLQDTVHDADDVKDSLEIDFNMGVFRGFGFGSGGDQVIDLATLDSTGWVEYNLYSISATSTASYPDTVMAVQLSDSTWWTDYPTPMWYIEIREKRAGKYRYFVNVFQFGDE